MKSSLLRRRTPLRSRTRLKALGRRGARLAKLDREVSMVVRSRGICELKELVPQVVCVGELQHHHVISRRDMEHRHDATNGLSTCSSHHSYLHHHPNIARKMGWIIDSKSKIE